MELPSTTAIKAAVAAGAGPAMLSSLAVAGDVAAGRLAAVRVAALPLRHVLRAVWPANRALSPAAAQLLATAAAPATGDTGAAR